jgi:hypothetical protein
LIQDQGNINAKAVMSLLRQELVSQVRALIVCLAIQGLLKSAADGIHNILIRLVIDRHKVRTPDLADQPLTYNTHQGKEISDTLEAKARLPE